MRSIPRMPGVRDAISSSAGGGLRQQGGLPRRQDLPPPLRRTRRAGWLPRAASDRTWRGECRDGRRSAQNEVRRARLRLSRRPCCCSARGYTRPGDEHAQPRRRILRHLCPAHCLRRARHPRSIQEFSASAIRTLSPSPARCSWSPAVLRAPWASTDRPEEVQRDGQRAERRPTEPELRAVLNRLTSRICTRTIPQRRSRSCTRCWGRRDIRIVSPPSPRSRSGTRHARAIVVTPRGCSLRVRLPVSRRRVEAPERVQPALPSRLRSLQPGHRGRLDASERQEGDARQRQLRTPLRNARDRGRPVRIFVERLHARTVRVSRRLPRARTRQPLSTSRHRSASRRGPEAQSRRPREPARLHRARMESAGDGAAAIRRCARFARQRNAARTAGSVRRERRRARANRRSDRSARVRTVVRAGSYARRVARVGVRARWFSRHAARLEAEVCSSLRAATSRWACPGGAGARHGIERGSLGRRRERTAGRRVAARSHRTLALHLPHRQPDPGLGRRAAQRAQRRGRAARSGGSRSGVAPDGGDRPFAGRSADEDDGRLVGRCVLATHQQPPYDEVAQRCVPRRQIVEQALFFDALRPSRGSSSSRRRTVAVISSADSCRP